MEHVPLCRFSPWGSRILPKGAPPVYFLLRSGGDIPTFRFYKVGRDLFRDYGIRDLGKRPPSAAKRELPEGGIKLAFEGICTLLGLFYLIVQHSNKKRKSYA
jgi:hypothetical protein